MTADPGRDHVAGKDGLVTRRQLVAFLDVSVRSFAELESAGVMSASRPGRGGRPSLYALATAVPAYIRHLERTRQPSNEREARARRDLAQAAISEQLLRRRSGDLLEREDVAHAWSSIVLAVRSRLLRMPTALADACAAATTPAEVQQILHAEVRDALRELSNWTPPADTTTPPDPTRRKRRTA